MEELSHSLQFTPESLGNILSEHYDSNMHSFTNPSLLTTRQAAVLVPIFYRSPQWMVLLSERSATLREHPREISFPGGRMETSDADLTECALRESNEEIGIAPARVTTLGHLAPVETRTGYTVWPTVGVIPDRYPFLLNSEEVAMLLEVPLVSLLNRDAVRIESFLQSNGIVIHRKLYTFDTHLIYGATARILDQLLEVCHMAAIET